MKKVKNFDFWPCQKSKLAISCRNGKTLRQIFYMLYSTWQTTRILIQSWKNVGGNFTYFCLGPKTEIGCWDLCFSVRSKILAFCGTLLREVLILVPNQNCAKKIYAGFLPGLEITSLKFFELEALLMLMLLLSDANAKPC